jgi:hypothetical protein
MAGLRGGQGLGLLRWGLGLLLRLRLRRIRLLLRIRLVLRLLRRIRLLRRLGRLLRVRLALGRRRIRLLRGVGRLLLRVLRRRVPLRLLSLRDGLWLLRVLGLLVGARHSTRD